MELVGALQPGLPTPAAIPGNAYRIIIDFKDCFHTVPLHPGDCERYTLSELACNFKEPMSNIIGKFCLKEWPIALSYVKNVFLLQYKKLGL